MDTHIHRLAQRWGLTCGKSVEQTEADLKALFPTHQWHNLHLQMIYFGREHCPAQRHDPTGCPICSWAAVAPYDRAGQSPIKAGQSPGKKGGQRLARGNTAKTEPLILLPADGETPGETLMATVHRGVKGKERLDDPGARQQRRGSKRRAIKTRGRPEGDVGLVSTEGTQVEAAGILPDGKGTLRSQSARRRAQGKPDEVHQVPVIAGGLLDSQVQGEVEVAEEMGVPLEAPSRSGIAQRSGSRRQTRAAADSRLRQVAVNVELPIGRGPAPIRRSLRKKPVGSRGHGGGGGEENERLQQQGLDSLEGANSRRESEGELLDGVAASGKHMVGDALAPDWTRFTYQG